MLPRTIDGVLLSIFFFIIPYLHRFLIFLHVSRRRILTPLLHSRVSHFKLVFLEVYTLLVRQTPISHQALYLRALRLSGSPLRLFQNFLVKLHVFFFV